MTAWDVSPSKLSPVRIVLIGWLLASISIGLDPLLRFTSNPALEDSSPYMRIVIGAFIACGSTALLLSRVQWKNTSTSWRLEIIGLPLLAAGWGLYTIALILIDGLVLFPIFLGAGHTLASVGRFLEVRVLIEDTRKNVEKLPPEVRDV